MTQIELFEYDQLEQSDREFIQGRTNEIKALVKRSEQDIIDIGQVLIEVKERLPHGMFGGWLGGEFGWSLQTAKRFMNVAETFENQQIVDFAPSALYLLAAPSTPNEAKEEAIDRASQGETITHKAAKKIVQIYKENEDKQSQSEQNDTYTEEEYTEQEWVEMPYSYLGHCWKNCYQTKMLTKGSVSEYGVRGIYICSCGYAYPPFSHPEEMNMETYNKEMSSGELPEDKDDLPPLVYDGVSFAYCKYCYETHDRWDLSGDHDPDAWECRNCGHFTADQYMEMTDKPEKETAETEEGLPEDKPKDDEMITDAEIKAPHAVHFSSTTPEWYTPQQVIDRVIKTFGEIDLDPCSNSGDNPNVPAARHYSKEDDGLSKEWIGRVYMNPPYGNELSLWVKKMLKEYNSGRISEAIILAPARTDTRWFQSLRQFPKCFVTGRLKFGGGSKNSAPFPSMLVYLGMNLIPFYNAFSDIGDVYELRSEYIETQ